MARPSRRDHFTTLEQSCTFNQPSMRFRGVASPPTATLTSGLLAGLAGPSAIDRDSRSPSLDICNDDRKRYMFGRATVEGGIDGKRRSANAQHAEAAYKAAVDNIIFLKRQQWLATNYALLAYADIFIISAHYFSELTLHEIGLACLSLRLLSTGVCCTYFNAQSRGLEIACVGFTGHTSAQRSVLDWMCSWNQDHRGVGAVLTAVYLWSVR
jgi:hypothetical protein